MMDSIREETQAKYLREWTLFEQWRRKLGFTTKRMATAPEVVAYMQLVAEERSPGVAVQVLAALNTWQKVQFGGIPFAPEIKKLRDGLQARQARDGPKQERKDPLPAKVVVAFARAGGETFGLTHAVFWTWVAGLMLGLRLGQRGASLARVRLRDVSERPTTGALEIRFPQTKRRPEGELLEVDFLEEEAEEDGVEALDWLTEEAVGPAEAVMILYDIRTKEGASGGDLLFVQKDRVSPMDTSQWGKVVKTVAAWAEEQGLIPTGGRWGVRSLRVGAANAMLQLGYSEPQVKAVLGWTGTTMRHYVRSTFPVQDKLSSRLFVNKPKQ